MNIDEALALVRDEAAFCRRSGEQCAAMTDRNDGYGDFLLRKAEAQEILLAEVKRLRAENERMKSRHAEIVGGSDAHASHSAVVL